MLTVIYVSDLPLVALKYTHVYHVDAVTDRDRILALSARLRVRGLRPGDSTQKVRATFPEAHIEPRDPSAEFVFWQKVVAEAHNITPFLYPEKPGWVILRGLPRLEARQAARKLGYAVGSGPDLLTARLAAIRAPVGHALFVSRENAKRFLQKSNVSMLGAFGFNKEIIERLGLFGFSSFESIRTLTRRQWIGQFGKEGGAVYSFLHDPLQAADVVLYQPPETISRFFIFELPTSNELQLSTCLAYLVKAAHARLRGRLVSALSLVVDQKPGGRVESTRLLSAPTNNVSVLATQARSLLLGLLKEPVSIAKIRIRFLGLREAPVEQLALFRQRPSLLPVILDLNRKYPDALFRMQIVNPNAAFHEERVERILFEPDSHEDLRQQRAR